MLMTKLFSPTFFSFSAPSEHVLQVFYEVEKSFDLWPSNLFFPSFLVFPSFLFFLSWSFLSCSFFLFYYSCLFFFSSLRFFLFLSLFFFLFLSFFLALYFCATGQLGGIEGGGTPPLLRRVQIAISSVPIVRFSPNLQKMKAKSKVTHEFWCCKFYQSTPSMWKIQSKL